MAAILMPAVGTAVFSLTYHKIFKNKTSMTGYVAACSLGFGVGTIAGLYYNEPIDDMLMVCIDAIKTAYRNDSKVWNKVKGTTEVGGNNSGRYFINPSDNFGDCAETIAKKTALQYLK